MSIASLCRYTALSLSILVLASCASNSDTSAAVAAKVLATENAARCAPAPATPFDLAAQLDPAKPAADASPKYFSLMTNAPAAESAPPEPAPPEPAPPEQGKPTDAPSVSDNETELAKKLTNPVANLISVPIQFNLDGGFGPKNANRLLVNIQPVIPISINDDWNLIVRTIVPVVYQDSIAHGIDSEFGLGDTTQSFFLSPKAPTPGGWIVGFGPVFLWPTATNDQLGSGKWGIGPTAVLLKQEKGFTYGVLANQIWSYAGEDDRSTVNATFIQPFLAYVTKTHTTFSVNTESTYDWTAHQWTIPVNFSVAQLVKIGNQPVQFAIGPRYYAQRPEGGPEWGVRFTVTFLFPK